MIHSPMHGRSTCTCQCHLFWPHSSKVAPARHPWPARGDGIHRGGDKSQSTGPTIHWRITPQSTGRTLLNPPAEHSSIHWPNTPQSTGPTLLNPLAQHFSIRPADIASIHPAELSIHRQYNPPTYNPPTVRFGRIHQPYFSIHPQYACPLRAAPSF